MVLGVGVPLGLPAVPPGWGWGGGGVGWLVGVVRGCPVLVRAGRGVVVRGVRGWLGGVGWVGVGARGGTRRLCPWWGWCCTNPNPVLPVVLLPAA